MSPESTWCWLYTDKLATFHASANTVILDYWFTYSLNLHYSGRNKTAEVTNKALRWSGTCLHDPSTGSCGACGFTLSYWIKLLSTSTTRLRFYLNSGQLEAAIHSSERQRSVTVFTDTSLLGVTISNLNVEWTLTLDATSYTKGNIYVCGSADQSGKMDDPSCSLYDRFTNTCFR